MGATGARSVKVGGKVRTSAFLWISAVVMCFESGGLGADREDAAWPKEKIDAFLSGTSIDLKLLRKKMTYGKFLGVVEQRAKSLGGTFRIVVDFPAFAERGLSRVDILETEVIFTFENNSVSLLTALRYGTSRLPDLNAQVVTRTGAVFIRPSVKND